MGSAQLLTGRERVTVAEAAYKVAEAAKLKGVSPDYVRAAIHSTGAHALRAKNVSSNPDFPRYRISASDLEAWWEGLPDA